jgi:hypothetical protein
MNDQILHVLLFAAVLFIITFAAGLGALIIAYFSQRAHISKLESALAAAYTGLQRPFQIPQEQIDELAGAISNKIPYTGVKQ